RFQGARLLPMRVADVPPAQLQAPSAFTRAASREILRLAVFLWRTPRLTPRMISGCAARSFSCAAAGSPAAIASSTLRMKVRIRERRALFTAVRRRVWRARLRDDGVLAMLLLARLFIEEI